MLSFNRKNLITTSWYIFGVAVPMIVGFIKNTVFTRVFSPKEYGQYALVTLTFSFATIFFMSWVSGIVWRFYQRYKLSKDLSVFYANIMVLYLVSFVFLVLFSFVFSLFQSDIYLIKLIFYTALFYITKEITVVLGIFLRLNDMEKEYNVVRLVQSTFGFGVLLLLVFSFQFRIEAFLFSSFLIDTFIIAYFLFLKKKHISIKKASLSVVKEFMNFGIKNIIISLLILGIVSSDRYIISIYDSIENVGIYNQLYNFSEISIGAILIVLYGIINPILTVQFEKDIQNAHQIIKNYFYQISIITIPFVVLLSIFAKPITQIIFHEDFAKYYYLVPFVLTSAYIFGLINLVELKLKFENKMGVIIVNYSICLIFNMVLNIIFIPIYGFRFAAVSTLLTYVLMFVLFYFKIISKKTILN